MEGFKKFSGQDEALMAIHNWERQLVSEKPEFIDEITSEIGELEVALLEEDTVRCERAANVLRCKITRIGMQHDIPDIGDALSGAIFLMFHFKKRVARITPDES